MYRPHSSPSMSKLRAKPRFPWSRAFLVLVVVLTFDSIARIANRTNTHPAAAPQIVEDNHLRPNGLHPSLWDTACVYDNITANGTNVSNQPPGVCIKNALVDVCNSRWGKEIVIIDNSLKRERLIRTFGMMFRFKQSKLDMHGYNVMEYGPTILIQNLYVHFPHFAESFFTMTPYLFERPPKCTRRSIWHKDCKVNLLMQYGDMKANTWNNGVLRAFSDKINIINKYTDVNLLAKGNTMWKDYCTTQQSKFYLKFDSLLMWMGGANTSELINNRPLNPDFDQHWFPTVADCGRFQRKVWDSVGVVPKPNAAELIILDRANSRGIINIKNVVRHIRDTTHFIPRVVYFDNSTFEEQVRVMARTKYLLAIHGAALANVAFIPPGATIIEVYPYMYVPKFMWYTGVADQCGSKGYPMYTPIGFALTDPCWARYLGSTTVSQCMHNFNCRVCVRKFGTRIDLLQLDNILQHRIPEMMKWEMPAVV